MTVLIGPSDRELRNMALLFGGLFLAALALAFGAGVAVGRYVL